MRTDASVTHSRAGGLRERQPEADGAVGVDACSGLTQVACRVIGNRSNYGRSSLVNAAHIALPSRRFYAVR
jgi:hypothetical protein